MSKVTIWAAKIEGSKYLYEKTEVETNKWINVPPYATEREVLIQGFDGIVRLGWVQSGNITTGRDGFLKISDLIGSPYGEPIKYYMIVPLPFDDPTDWHFMDDEAEKTPRKNKPYIVALEIRENGRTTYNLATSYYSPGKYSDWAGYDFKECSRTVIAWREFPRPKRT